MHRGNDGSCVSRNEDQASARRIMTQADTGRGQGFAGLIGERGGFPFEHRRLAVERIEDGFDSFARDGSWTIEHCGLLGGIEDGGFHAAECRAGIENGIDAVVEVLENVRGGGGADVAEAIGAGRGERNAGAADEFERDRMPGHADTDQGARCCDDIRDARGARQQQRERARPKGVDEDLRDRRDGRDDGLGHGRIADVDDERIPVWALLGEKDFGDSVGIEGICGESVDGFRGHGHSASGAQNLRCLIKQNGIGGGWLPGGVVDGRKLGRMGCFDAEMQRCHRSIIYSQPGQIPYTRQQW